MSKYQFGSIVDRDFRLELQRLADDAAAQGKAIQDLVAEGQLTEEQYAELLTSINGLVKSGQIDKSDLTSEFKDEIEEFNVQLAQRPTKSYVDKNKRDISVPIGLNDTSSELLSAIQGGDGTSFNLLSIPKFKSVTPARTNFIEMPENLFDKRTLMYGYYIGPDGQFVEDEDYAVSDLIEISPDLPYIVNRTNPISFYDSDHNFISRLGGGVMDDRLLTIPENAIYMRLNVRTTYIDSVQVNQSESLLPYSTYKDPILKDVDLKPKWSRPFVVTATKPNRKFVIDFKNNIIDFNNIAIIWADKRNYIAGNPGTKIDISSYDEYQTYLIIFESDPVPALKVFKQNQVTTELEEDDIILGGFNPITQEVFGLDNIEIIKRGNDSQDFKEASYIKEIDKMTDVVEMQDASADGLNISEFKSSDVFDLWDELLDSDYVTKELFYNEATGLPCYRYNFTPKRADITRTSEKTKRPHFFINSGVHPGERASWWALYNVFKLICENWKTSDILRTLRWDVDFSVIPIVNVWGLDNGNAATNSNGVDINRNFPEGWVKTGTPGSHGYSGESSASEIETQALMDIFQNENIDYYGDFHNFFAGAEGTSNRFIWNIGSTMWNLEMSEKLISHISQKWKMEKPEIPQDDNIFYGDMATSHVATPIRYIETLGINGSTFEIRQQAMFGPNPKDLSALTITLGVDAQINWLYQMYRNIIG